MPNIKKEVSESGSYEFENEASTSETEKRISKSKISVKKELQAPKRKKRSKYSHSDSSSEYEDVSTRRLKSAPQKNDDELTSSETLLDTFKKLFNYSNRSNTEWTLESINDDVEVFKVVMPKSLDPELLVNTSMFFNGKKKVKVGEQRYKWKLNDKNMETISVVASSKQSKCGILHLQTNGTFEVTEVLKNANESSESFVKDNEEHADEYSKLKKRHQFLCSDYTNLKLDKDVASKLNTIDMCVNKKSHKRKRKLELHNDISELFNGEELNHFGKKRKTRRKFQEEAVSAVKNEDIYNLLIPHHKKSF